MRYGRTGYTSPTHYAELKPDGGGFAFSSSFDRGLVDALKAEIPADSRRWDQGRKLWLVDAKYGAACAKLAQRYLGVTIAVPDQTATAPIQDVIRLEYLGRCKARPGQGEPTAYGWANGGWNYVFPASVLREWFHDQLRPGDHPTLYATLGIGQGVDPAEIRTAYRRLARQWHPDVCHEEGAAEQFKAIQRAYEVLTDDLTRKKYDAGLLFEASLQRTPAYVRAATADFDGYRTPLRCGNVLIEGTPGVRTQVSKIAMWEDIVDGEGRVMVASWPLGAEKFEVRWQ